MSPRAPLLGLALLLAACDRDGDGTVRLPDRPPERPSGIDLPPVAVNPNSPITYPSALANQGLEGTVLLRLYVDSAGRLVGDSTRVAESSGYPALDSAALRGVTELRFAPAERDGQRVAVAFLQPVHFRSPQGRVIP
ncbi:MAG: energy transducer TonB [Gemmatimonadales bacterium]|jgi:TonB family protein|nr:energy transducer TonB [Gemmatimonadales bacterium]